MDSQCEREHGSEIIHDETYIKERGFFGSLFFVLSITACHGASSMQLPSACVYRCIRYRYSTKARFVRKNMKKTSPNCRIKRFICSVLFSVTLMIVKTRYKWDKLAKKR